MDWDTYYSVETNRKCFELCIACTHYASFGNFDIMPVENEISCMCAGIFLGFKTPKSNQIRTLWENDCARGENDYGAHFFCQNFSNNLHTT